MSHWGSIFVSCRPGRGLVGRNVCVPRWCLFGELTNKTIAAGCFPPRPGHGPSQEIACISGTCLCRSDTRWSSIVLRRERPRELPRFPHLGPSSLRDMHAHGVNSEAAGQVRDGRQSPRDLLSPEKISFAYLAGRADYGSSDSRSWVVVSLACRWSTCPLQTIHDYSTALYISHYAIPT